MTPQLSNSHEVTPTIYPAATEGDITFEAFLDLVPDGVKADLIDGVIYMASPDNTDANSLNGWLTAILFPFVEIKDLGKIYISRVAYRIGPKRGPEPDLSFVSKAREALRRRGFIDGPPDMAIEIVSPDSIDRDYVAKRGMFEQAGVGEYWILDPDQRQATFLRLHECKFIEVPPVEYIFRSQVLPGFEIDVRWLWAQPRPQAYTVLRRLLEGTGAK